MRNLTKFTGRGGRGASGIALGIGALVATAALAASAAVVVGDPLAPRAVASAGLTPFQSCADLRTWYVDSAVREVGPFGWTTGYGPQNYTTDAAPLGMAERSPALASGSGLDKGMGSSATGTNTQESGVDEPDLAKTNGTLLVRVVGRSVVVSDVTGAQPRQLGSYALPPGMFGADLLLAGDRVVVSSTSAGYPGGPTPMAAPGRLPGSGVAPNGARVITLDIADPTRPQAVSDKTFSGTIVSMRQYGSTVRLVTSTGRPLLKLAYAGQGGLNDNQTTARNRAIVRSSSLNDWLPTVRDSSQSASSAQPLAKCADVLHPRGRSGLGTVAVVGFDVHSPDARSTVAVTAGGDTVYSSTRALYVATTQLSTAVVPRISGVAGGYSRPAEHTEIHEFDLFGHSASYVATGSVRGVVRDRWSMDEYAGHLRLAVQTGSATTLNDGAQRSGSNAILTLARRGDRLVVTGRVGGLGYGEEIKSVRWFDGLAVLVTFRQMDPLYTVDLSDPAHPKLMGQLKIPGFSGYLHPIGHGRLLGLGTDATLQGRSRGALVSVFDLSDLRHPTQVARQTLGPESYLGAVDDPRAFTWVPGANAGFGQLQSISQTGGFQLARIGVGVGGSLSVTTEQVPGVPAYAMSRVLPLPDGRMLLVAGDTTRTMSP
ncbi:MAG: beta-propeller domain-containing protein [Actinomycetota bacterium]|nr:beta-propeller domain-containing protein [Actinomycetota bacterium]